MYNWHKTQATIKTATIKSIGTAINTACVTTLGFVGASEGTCGVGIGKDREVVVVGRGSMYDEFETTDVAGDVVGGEDITGGWEAGVCVDA